MNENTEYVSNSSDTVANVSVLEDLKNFYEYHIVETVDESLQIFRSFTYGEMVISLLLLCILLVMIFKWIWAVLR